MTIPFYRTIKRSRKKGLGNLVYTISLGVMFQVLSPTLTKRQLEYRMYSSDIIREINGSKMLLCVRDKGISKDLFLYRKREPLSTDYLINSGVIKEGDIVLDIGANIGYYALLESRLVGNSGKVYAIEPVSRNLEILKKNIKLNDCRNIQVFHLAIGDKNTKSKIYVSGTDFNLCSMSRNPDMNIIGEETVDVITVDSFLEGRDAPQLIRMDVEGYECNILKGMKNTVKKPIKMLIEIHGHLMTKEESNAMFNMLRKNGFKVDFAVYDITCIVNRVAVTLIRKMGLSLPRIINVDMAKVQEWIVEKRMSAHVLFSKVGDRESELL